MKGHLFSLQNIYSSTKLTDLPYFKTKRTQRVTTLSLSLLTLSIFGFFAINPTLSTITNLKKQLSDSKFVNQQLTEKISNLRTLQQKYTALSEDLPFVEQAIPSKPNVPILMGELRALAKTANVRVVNLQSMQIDLINKKSKQFGSFAFVIQVRGTDLEITSFLKSLTNFDRIITFDSVSISQGNDADPSLRLSIRGKAYYKNTL